MPSDRKQINVRVDDETRDLLPALCRAIGDAVGLVVTNSDLFRMGISELKKKYLPGGVAPETETPAEPPAGAAKKSKKKK